MDLADIGEKVFSFTWMLSLLMTIVVLAMAAGGVDLSKISTPLFLPATWFYSQVKSVVATLPSQPTALGLFMQILGTVVGTALLQFLAMMLGGFLLLIASIASMVPPDCVFLVAPLYFAGCFFQFCIWIFYAKKIYTLLRG